MNKTSNFKDPVIKTDQAIKIAGNKANIARILGLSRATVTDWGDVVPALHAYRLLQVYPTLNTH